MSQIYPAATVILLRNGSDGLETLLLRRARKLSFAGGLWVFPGGRIDPLDYGEELGDIERAARQAAVREALEETDLSVHEQSLMYFSHWTTPPGLSRRFATWFFICEAKGDTDNVVVDGGEIVEHRWCRPQHALADLQRKHIDMMPPTFVTLTELAESDSVAQALANYRHRPIPEFHPRLIKSGDDKIMLYAGDAGYEARDQHVAGARHRLTIKGDVWCYQNRTR
jgi:8-oxo-dGTP pyrophosphatase MutT (NUDIX family)